MEIDTHNISRKLSKLRKEASVKECFFSPLGCSKKPIRAHSISATRYLQPLAEDGKLYTMDINMSTGKSALELKGKKTVSTFPGFCDEHDKIFLRIDNENYLPGDKEQEFLFALRALGRELWAKKLQRNGTTNLLKNIHMLDISPRAVFLRTVLEGAETAVNDLLAAQQTMLEHYTAKRFNGIHTHSFSVVPATPIVASSTFMIELDTKGNIVNDLANLKSVAKLTFLTVFPQSSNTYFLVSSLSSQKRNFNFLGELNALSNTDLKVALSNLLTVHVENFAISPAYWRQLDENIKDQFASLWGHSALPGPRTAFVEDPSLNILN